MYKRQEGAGENIDKDSYDGIESARNIATVTSSNGKPVKMRAEPSETCRLYWNIPVSYTHLTDEREAGKRIRGSQCPH